jgi:hypothetical protein
MTHCAQVAHLEHVAYDGTYDRDHVAARSLVSALCRCRQLQDLKLKGIYLRCAFCFSAAGIALQSAAACQNKLHASCMLLPR